MIKSEIPPTILEIARHERNAQKRRAEIARGNKRLAMSKAQYQRHRGKPITWRNKQQTIDRLAFNKLKTDKDKSKRRRLEMIRICAESKLLGY